MLTSFYIYQRVQAPLKEGLQIPDFVFCSLQTVPSTPWFGPGTGTWPCPDHFESFFKDLFTELEKAELSIPKGKTQQRGGGVESGLHCVLRVKEAVREQGSRRRRRESLGCAPQQEHDFMTWERPSLDLGTRGASWLSNSSTAPWPRLELDFCDKTKAF